MLLSLYDKGVVFDHGKPDRDTPLKGGGKRGKLVGQYSSASFRRLRTFCITHDCSGLCWGVTLTIPGLSLVRLEYVQTWLHNITQYANYWHIPLIWRAELQRRGQAHFHMVVYGDVEQCLRLCYIWQKQVMKSGKCISIERVGDDESDAVWINRAFVRGSSHMFDIQPLFGDFRSWRYLVAHESKAKQAQRGWLGRQWGVLQKKAFSVSSSVPLDLNDSQFFSVRRWVRRLTRRRINGIGKHFLLVNPATVKRMANYAVDLPF